MSEETMYRYLLALPRGDRKVFLSWRLLDTDTPDTHFHIERQESGIWKRINTQPVTDSTNFLDITPYDDVYKYRIVAIKDKGSEISESIAVDSGAEATIIVMDIPLPVPATSIQHIIAGDMLNNKRMGYVLRGIRGNTVWMFAYSHEGKALWEIDTKLPAKGGWDGSTLHVPFLCWDVNYDGRTEVAFHSYKGLFPTETYEKGVSDEFLTVVDSETGELVWETPWPGVKPRVMMTVGHLQGIDRPASLVILDGTYASDGYVLLTAINGKTGKIDWQIKQKRPAGHNLDIGDIDEDGIQEVICGGVCYNGDGSVRWEAEPFGHTDISKPARIDPNREGMQIWYAVESNNPGIYLVDKDGKTIFKEPFHHAHYGWIARHTNEFPGLQPHTAEDARSSEQDHFPIYLPDGSHWMNLTDWQRKNFVPVHWDEGSVVVFIIRKENKRIVRLKNNGEIEDLPEGRLPEGGIYGRNLLCADIIGDYRENIVTLDSERDRLIVLANPTVAKRRGYSPYTNFEYAHDRSQHGSGYYIYLSPPDTII
ncbi:MAG: rhamnogalacturonan lyase family protein [bacterium]